MINNTDIKILSILICTIPERKNMFSEIFTELHTQINYCKTVHPTLGDANIIVDGSKKFNDGGKNIGKKREGLVNLATAKYLCFLDDDEKISPDFVETLLRLCCEDKDVCTFRSLATLKNNWALVDMSLNNIFNEQINPDKITYRRPWHVCPVRSEFAKKYPFEDSNYGEDWIWFDQVLKDCETESHTDRIIHNYNHGAHSEADKIK